MDTNKEKILISDSCILFDLIDLEIADSFFDMDYEVYTTPMVVEEISNEEQYNTVSGFIDKGRLKIDNEDSYDAVEILNEEHKGLSYTDCSVLELAIRKDGVVLSGDKSLRNELKRRGIAVCGILWIIERLLAEKLLTKKGALTTLKKYPEVNKRVPLADIEALIRRIENIKE